MKYGKELLIALKNSIKATNKIQEEREARINSGQTDAEDCFISIRSNEQSNALDLAKIEILEAGGVAEFNTLEDLEGNIVSRKLIDGKYGLCWVIDEQYQAQYGRFVGEPKRENTLIRKGLKWGVETAPAWASYKASGSGMMGAYTAYVVVFRSQINYWTGK